MANYIPQYTLQYSTFIKRALVESLQAAFNAHPTAQVANANVAIDFGRERWKLPGVIIKFYERELPNAGVGHVEWGVSPQDPNPAAPTMFIKYYHRLYQGDIGFDIYAMSSVDRDLVRDALIEVLTMNEATDSVTSGGTNFLNRFYLDMENTPYGTWHFPVLMLDKITGYGEQHQSAPWQPEDTLVYSVSYRVPIWGEFYSLTPTLPASTGLLQEVDVYPYAQNFDGVNLEPTPAENPDAPTVYNPNVPRTDPTAYTTANWYRFTGWPAGAEII